MKIKFTAIIILAVASALAVYGYFSAVPAPRGEDALKPRIEIIEPIFDFGLIRYGDKVSHVYKIKNSGSADLEINKVATSCGCTSAQTSKDNLSPGEEAELAVTYDSAVMSGAHAKGEQERIIYVKTNDPASPMAEARIKAYVQ